MKILCKKSDLDGYGVFASEDIKQGEIIESCPVVVVPYTEWNHIKHSKLVDYIFEWTPEIKSRMAYPLGYAMIYNHSYSPNAKTAKDIENSLMNYIAVRDIPKGEEITHNYTGNPYSKEQLWFEVKY